MMASGFAFSFVKNTSLGNYDSSINKGMIAYLKRLSHPSQIMSSGFVTNDLACSDETVRIRSEEIKDPIVFKELWRVLIYVYLIEPTSLINDTMRVNYLHRLEDIKVIEVVKNFAVNFSRQSLLSVPLL